MEYMDIADSPEDTRIRLIGEKTMSEKMVVGFVTDDEAGKADRYITKLLERFPGIRVIGRGNGPAEGMVWVKVGSLLQ